jgi:hypothetical protein
MKVLQKVYKFIKIMKIYENMKICKNHENFKKIMKIYQKS